MKILIIAEKPSVAQDYKKALSSIDNFDDSKGFFEGDQYIISYAVGHLLTIQEPKEINPSYRSWSLKNLPILPPSYPIKPIAKTETQLKILVKLIKRKDVKTIINGCDAGREGELIFRYILEYVGEKIFNGKNIQRLWLRSMTHNAIIEGFQNLKADQDMIPLYHAARSRAEADWVVGMNASRALTGYQSQQGGFNLTPCGRVQTPTLMMMTLRERERREFKPQEYFIIKALFQGEDNSYSGKWFDIDNDNKKKQDKNDKSDRIWNIEQAQDVISKCRGKKAFIQEKQKKQIQNPPLLYDLTSLQKEASSRFGFSAKMTLSIAQSLYETHKLITYPRTSSKYLPLDYKSQVGSVLKSFLNFSFMSNIQSYVTKILQKGYLDQPHKRIFDDSKVSDHFAIIPNILTGNKKLVDNQQKIYLMIVQRFIAAFYPAAEFLNTTRITEVENEFFKTEGKILVKPGYLEIYDKEEQENNVLGVLGNIDSYYLDDISMEQLQTKPPSCYTESTLLSAMEYAGRLVEDETLKEVIKDMGIGTPATRASIIEKLIEDKYILREQGVFIPTEKAMYLDKLIHAMEIEQLGSPELTGDWEFKLLQIEKGSLERTQFMNDITNAVKNIVHCISSFDESSTLKSAGFKLLDQEFDESLSEYISKDRSVRIRKVMGGRSFSKDEVIELLTNKKIGPLEGFRSRRGFPFSAMIILDDNYQTQFQFEEDFTLQDLKGKEIIGKSFIDQSDIYSMDTAYVSESFVKGEKTGLKIARIILGKEIEEEEVKSLVQGKKTSLIEGFRSPRTRKLFKAYLKLDQEGKMEFSFEEKKKKTAPRKSVKKSKSTMVKKTTKKSSTNKKK